MSLRRIERVVVDERWCNVPVDVAVDGFPGSQGRDACAAVRERVTWVGGLAMQLTRFNETLTGVMTMEFIYPAHLKSKEEVFKYRRKYVCGMS